MNTLLITGAAGFIGGNFVRIALQKTTHRIVLIDKLTYAGNMATVADPLKDSRVSFVRADISDRKKISEIINEEKPFAVINFAAETHVDRSIDDPEAFIRTNIVGLYTLLETCRQFIKPLSERNKKSFRFIHVSTDEIYGSLGSKGSFNEESPYRPNSPYAASKAAGDHLIRAYYETYKFPGIVTNCSNNYGPFQFPEKLIPLMILNALEGKQLPVYGDGKNVRDWLYVEDHCEALLRVLQRGKPGEKYNIGAHNEKNNIELVKMLCDILEKVLPARNNTALISKGYLRYRELIKYVVDRPAHDRRYAIDASKIRRKLGWKPRYDFQKGLAQTVRWYVDNVKWCRAVQGKYGRERLGVEK